jgi:hypothetical protein
MIDPTVSPSRVRTAPASTIKEPACSRGSLSRKDLASCRVEHACTCGCVLRGEGGGRRSLVHTEVSGTWVSPYL